MIRSLLVFFACVLAGSAVLAIGTAALPQQPHEPQALHDALAGRSFDLIELERYNRALRRPGLFLVWGIMPIAASIMGITAGLLDGGSRVLVAPLSIVAMWIVFTWGALFDTYNLSFGVLYTLVGAAAAWGSRVLFRSARRQIHEEGA